MASTGFTNAGCGVGWDNGPSRGVWSGVSNITAEAGSASVVRDRGTFPFPSIAGYNYGFNIPSGATIDGIEVKLLFSFSSTVTGVARSRIVQGLSNTYCNNSNAAGVEGTLTLYDTIVPGFVSGVAQTIGGPTELWGRGSPVWTPEEINASDFGFEFDLNYSTSTSSPLASWNQNYIQINVYYTEPNVIVGVGSPATSITTSTFSIQLPEIVGASSVAVATQAAGIKEDDNVVGDAAAVVLSTQGVLVAGDDAQPVDLQTVNVSLFNPTIPPVVVSTDLQTITLTTQNASTADFEEITNTPTVSVNNLDVDVVGDVFVTGDLQTVSLSTFSPELDESVILDTQSVSVSSQDARVIFGFPVPTANVSVNPLDAELDFAFIPDLAQVNINTQTALPLVPPPGVLTLTSSVYQPVAITSRRVDLRFVEEDSAELIVIQTYGSPRVI